MNDKTKYQLAGAVIGAGLGYLVGSVITDITCPEYEEVEKMTDDTTNDVTVDDRYERGRERVREQALRRKPKTKRPMSEAITYNNLMAKPPLSELTKRYRTMESDEPPLGSSESVLPIEGNHPEDVEVISADEYGQERGYTTATLCHYSFDDVTTDENKNVVGEVETLIGDDGLLSFGENSGDDDVVFVRNKRLKCDYEVTRINDSYSRLVLRIKPETTKQKTTRVNMINDAEMDD